MSDLIDYVMDMVQDNVERQIDALEDLKDKYAELIDARKEAMEVAKEEDEYEQSIADQIKEIADLQQRIDILSLDDSRDAQAQKIQLEEELAELQKELA